MSVELNSFRGTASGNLVATQSIVSTYRHPDFVIGRGSTTSITRCSKGSQIKGANFRGTLNFRSLSPPFVTHRMLVPDSRHPESTRASRSRTGAVLLSSCCPSGLCAPLHEKAAARPSDISRAPRAREMFNRACLYSADGLLTFSLASPSLGVSQFL